MVVSSIREPFTLAWRLSQAISASTGSASYQLGCSRSASAGAVERSVDFSSVPMVASFTMMVNRIFNIASVFFLSR
jgi:hypothetical protein